MPGLAFSNYISSTKFTSLPRIILSKNSSSNCVFLYLRQSLFSVRYKVDC